MCNFLCFNIYDLRGLAKERQSSAEEVPGSTASDASKKRIEANVTNNCCRKCSELEKQHPRAQLVPATNRDINGSTRKGTYYPAMELSMLRSECLIHGCDNALFMKKPELCKWYKENVKNNGGWNHTKTAEIVNNNDAETEDPTAPNAIKDGENDKATQEEIYCAHIPEYKDLLERAESGDQHSLSCNKQYKRQSADRAYGLSLESPGALDRTCETRNERKYRKFRSLCPLPYIANLPDFAAGESYTGWVLCLTLILVGHVWSYSKYKSLACAIAKLPGKDTIMILSNVQFDAIILALLIISNRILDEKIEEGHKVSCACA